MHRPFSVYVHIPFCRKRCGYCDFNSYAVRNPPEREYTDAVVSELRHRGASPCWRRGAVGSVYFGGGTPSLFSPAAICRMLETIEELWPPAGETADVEVTIEANPGTVDADRLRAFRGVGITRLSLGVQSFDSAVLARLGRIHNAAEARAAVEMARRAGFDNINLDLMFAVPGQTPADWEKDLRVAVELCPEHVSPYCLTFEPGTRFAELRERGMLKPPGAEVEAEMIERAEAILTAAGYRRYEISNYALPGYESRHNVNYWKQGDYLGVGAGAHSSVLAGGEIRRWRNVAQPGEYGMRVATAGSASIEEEQLSGRAQQCDFVFLGLRMLEGIHTAEFAARFGADFETAFPQVTELERQGLLECRGSCWRLTRRGLMVADSVIATFLDGRS